MRISPEWQDMAACKDTDIGLWFPPDNTRGQREKERITAAKQVCSRCPVVIECLDSAVRNNDIHGIYAGLTPQERRNINKGIR